MRSNIIEVLFKIMTNKKNYNELDLIKLKYGLEGSVMFFEKLIVIIVLSLLFNILYEVSFFMILYMGIKLFSGGAHAKNSSSCLFISILIFIGIPMITNFINFDFNFKLFISLIGFLLFYIYSPASTHKRPIQGNNNILKIKSLLILDIYCIASLMLNNNIGALIIWSVIIQMFFITPFAYKVLKVPYVRREI